MARENINDLLTRVLREGGRELLRSPRELEKRLADEADSFPPIELDGVLQAACAGLPADLLAKDNLSTLAVDPLAEKLAAEKNVDPGFAVEVVRIWRDVLIPFQAEWRAQTPDPNAVFAQASKDAVAGTSSSADEAVRREAATMLKANQPEAVTTELINRGLGAEHATQIVEDVQRAGYWNSVIIGVVVLCIPFFALAAGLRPGFYDIFFLGYGLYLIARGVWNLRS